jgi:hypothetical protein
MALSRTIAVKASGSVGAAGGNSSTYTNRDCKGVTVVVKNTAGSGTSPTITVKLQENYSGAGWVDVTGATTAAIAAGTPGTTSFTVYPGVTVAANAGVSRPLAKTWRLAWAIGGSATPTGTFSVDANLHP